MRRIPQLDILRGIAVLLVIAFHYDNRFPGWVGVDLFFVLSGYLILGLLFNDPRIGRFLIRRGFKIYPTYFAFIVIVMFFTHRMAWPELTFTQNYARPVLGVWPIALVPLWSIAVEEHFYLLLPFLLVVISRKRLPYLALFVMAGCLAVRLFMAFQGYSRDQIVYSTHTRIDALFCGVALRYMQPQSRPWMLPAGIICLAPAVMLSNVTFGLTTNAIGFTLIVAWSVGQNWLRWKPLEQIGVYSYSIYIWHYLVVLTCRLIGLPMFAAIAVAIALGVVSALIIELPSLAWRERIFAGPSLFSKQTHEPILTR